MPPPAASPSGRDAITLNFVNAEIDAVVKAVAEITGRNFVVDPRVKGTVNIVSARPVPRSLVYPTLLSALRLAGYAAVEGEGVVKIVPEADAKTQGGPVGVGRGDRLVTQVIVLRNESAAGLVNVLRPLITPNNTIAAFPASNALVITDYADNLRRIERIVASLDQPDRSEPMLVPVRHASAIDVATMVNRLLVEPSAAGAPADPQQRVTLVPDPRSNSILVRSENAGRAARVRSLIEQLDTPGRPGGNLFIVYLRNAEAAKVAQTLRALLSGGEAPPAPPAPSIAPPGAFSVGTAQAAMPAAAAPPLPFAAPATGAPASGLQGVTVQADVANNALIIMAPEPVYNNLRAIVEKLDVRRAQVYVEALIVEVAADRAAELGVQWQALSGYNTTGTRVLGGTNFGPRGTGSNIIDVSVAPGTVAPGLNIGVMRGTVNIPGLGTITNLAFLARALETNVNANILSTPALMTLDNEEARIVVGQNVPFVTGSYATTGNASTVTPFQTVERRDVGLVLRVRPQITEGGAVRLNIYQEVSRVQDASSATGIILSKRALESHVVVDDSQVVVLGGLIEDRLTDGNDKVPVAGDVPIVGSLFRYDARRREKTNLMVFLKPTVVRGVQEGREITSERYDYLMGEQQRVAPAPLPYWPDPSKPELPPPGSMPGDGGAQTSGYPQPPHPLAPFVPPPPAPPAVPVHPATPVVPNPSLPAAR
ncbi:MAG: type II secretion system secretin GspD [Burkholderiales bacterium]|nr:type II secretion system secretin GspD [Burkholderiales bacterium]GIK84728.1 MAG: type II secretion system protein GspD [Betaproteobacteria bacterium]